MKINIIAMSLIMTIMTSNVSKENADMIVKNANIYTVDAQFNKAEAFAIKDGKFIDIGSNDYILSKYDAVKVIDTQGNKTSLIILLHDCGDKKATPDTLKKIIKHYKGLGYEFKNFYDIFTEETIQEESENIN